MTAFGACAVSLMVVGYALERRHRVFVAFFALGCGLSSLYGFAIDSVPIGLVEALWGLVAVHRYLAIGGIPLDARALKRQ